MIGYFRKMIDDGKESRRSRMMASFKKEADQNIVIKRVDGVDYIFAFGYPVTIKADSEGDLLARLAFIKEQYVNIRLEE